jgi:hypothetical protein
MDGGFVFLTIHRIHLPLYPTNLGTCKSRPLDKNQEIVFARILLKVSGVIPIMEAKYCSGTKLNNSGLCSIKRW